MDTNNELILHIYETADMGIKSMTKLLNILKKKDNKIKKDISSQLKEYECIYKDAKKILEENGTKKIGGNIIANISVGAAMSMELDEDNSDAKVADILLRGYTMGILEMEKKIEDYGCKVEKNSIKLAKKLLTFQKESVEELKKYL